jgi:hypothetical protein
VSNSERYLSCLRVHKKLTEYVEFLNGKDVTKSEAWTIKVRMLNKDLHVFPYFLYFDGMSPDNALGSHIKFTRQPQKIPLPRRRFH